RKSEEKKSPHNLNKILDHAVELASNDYDLKKKYDFRQIEIIRRYDRIPDIPCIEGQIEQVFLNLLKNAAHAMSEKKYEKGEKSSITIHTYVDSGYVVAVIEDNGPGMSEDVQRKIFEPFFTTKDPGHGTGLGLSVSYFIVVSNHKGQIQVSSEKGSGAAFLVGLPIADA
ncbi:MAG: sensor histidine kinase, partial [Spirochaetota bacterium]